MQHTTVLQTVDPRNKLSSICQGGNGFPLTLNLERRSLSFCSARASAFHTLILLAKFVTCHSFCASPTQPVINDGLSSDHSIFQTQLCFLRHSTNFSRFACTRHSGNDVHAQTPPSTNTAATSDLLCQPRTAETAGRGEERACGPLPAFSTTSFGSCRKTMTAPDLFCRCHTPPGPQQSPTCRVRRSGQRA